MYEKNISIPLFSYTSVGVTSTDLRLYRLFTDPYRNIYTVLGEDVRDLRGGYRDRTDLDPQLTSGEVGTYVESKLIILPGLPSSDLKNRLSE